MANDGEGSRAQQQCSTVGGNGINPKENDRKSENKRKKRLMYDKKRGHDAE